MSLAIDISGCSVIASGSFLWSSLNFEYGVGLWSKPRGENLLDSGAPFYDTYKTKDDKYMAVGALEPQFYAKLLESKLIHLCLPPNIVDMVLVAPAWFLCTKIR